MTFKSLAATTLTLTCVLTAPAYAQVKGNEIQTVSLGDNLYMLTGPGGNIGVSVGDDGVFVIDDKFSRFADQIVAQIAAITDEPIRFVINTHYHGDHTGANAEMKGVGATIVAHDNVRKRMGMTFDNKLWGREVKAVSEDKWPTVTFSDTTTLYFNGDAVHVIHTPSAHTDGDSIIHFRDTNVIHMGDNYFNGMFPYVDVDSGGTLQGMIAAHELALSLSDEDTQIIPGHGPMATKADLKDAQSMLKDILKTVKKAKKKGKSEDDIIEAGVLSNYSEYSSFIDEANMIRIAYRSLEQTR